jgi:hypothetical protein
MHATEHPRRWYVHGFLLFGLALFLSGQTIVEGGMRKRYTLLTGALLFAVCGVAWLTHRRWWPPLRTCLEAHTDALDAIPEKRLDRWIALASALGLFVELMLIRWHASVFQFFAYYKNVSLLACFLGLGIGYAMGTRRPVATPAVLPALAFQFVALYLLGFSGLAARLHSPFAEQKGLALHFIGTTGNLAMVYGFLIIIFGITVLTCIPLGHLCSRLMQRRPAQIAYAWNLAGSLAGIVLFSLLSYAWTPPSVWLTVAALGAVPFMAHSRPVMMTSLVATGVALAVLALPLRPEVLNVYSPYQIISLLVRSDEPPHLQVNHVYYQRIVNLSEKARAKDPLLKPLVDYYELPYRFKPEPERVLVVGSGTGNDVAAGLRRNAGHIDAVEIDPVILSYGETLHPEAPYADPRVTTILEDARNFIRETDRRYDLIVYGLLDSHTLLTGLSSVRLDSFVYTVDAFREARARLAPGGIIAMTFAVLGREQGKKFFLMLEEAFNGRDPRVLQTEYDGGVMFLAGEGLPESVDAAGLAVKDVTDQYRDETVRADVSTDDWPFLYMPVRKYPISYLAMFSVLLLFAVAALRQFMAMGAGRFSAVSFFLGAGFMLVETKGITELALTFGNTWQVVSVVIAGVMIMALLANALVLRVGIPHPAATYGLLASVLLAGLFFSGTVLASLPRVLVKLFATILVTAPLFFSGLAFSAELRRSGDIGPVLSANLIGAMLGGFLEYNSLYFGFRSLYWFALALYGLAFVASLRGRGGEAGAGLV